MTGSGEPEPCRFGQLTYTSYDPPASVRAGGGGWQVKEVGGNLSDPEQELMRAGVATRFEPTSPPPPFPTPDDLLARPRRLSYAPVAGGAGCYWHTVAAGADASGRPGNVFAHVLLDRDGCVEAGAVRPVELWRSDGWLVPYGADAVARASLPAGAPAAGTAVNRTSVLGFLLDPGTWRIGVLSVLLDAVARAMAGGPAVVLGTDTPESAALWIGAVSAFMSPGSARGFGWCTFDRLPAVEETVTRGAHLVAVPHRDVEDLPGLPGLVLIDENETPDLGELGGEPHRTAGGEAVSVTAWSVLAQTILVDVESAERTLAQQDSIARRAGDRGLSPMWPLAMAVTLEPELHDGHDEAAQVILAQSPAAVVDDPDLAAVPLAVVDAQFGPDTESAWQALVRLLEGDAVAPAIRILAGRMFLFRVLDDHRWIRGCTRDQRARLDPAWSSHDLSVAADRVVAALRAHARDVATRQDLRALAADAVALLDVLVEAGLLTGPGGDVMFEVLEEAVVPILCDPVDGPALAADIGPVGIVTRLEYLQVALATHPVVAGRPLGARVPPLVLRWVVGETGQSVQSALADDPGRIAEPLSMLVADGVRAAVASGELDVTNPKLLIVLRRALFEAAGSDGAVGELHRVLEEFAWTPRHLSLAVTEHPGAVPLAYLRNAIVADPWGPEVKALVSHAAGPAGAASSSVEPDTHSDGLTTSWAVIRGWGRWGNPTEYDIRPLLDRHARPVLRDYAERAEADLPRDVLVRLALLTVACRADLSSGRGPMVPQLPDRHEDALVRAVRVERQPAVTVVSSWVRSGVIDLRWAVAYAVFTSPPATRLQMAVDRRDLLCRMEIGSPDEPQSLLEVVVLTLMEEPDYRGPADAQGVMDAIRTVLRQEGGIDVEYACKAYAPFVRGWIERRSSSVDRPATGRLRRK